MDSGEGALQGLLAGNQRHVENRGKTLAKHLQGQKPVAAVLTCADSRVIPEFIFDTEIGEIFVVRIAGNVAMDSSVIESLEYAVNHLGVSLIVVLGHTNCGAVMAADAAGESTQSLLKEIQECFEWDGDHFLANTMRQTAMLWKRSESMAKAVDEGRLKITGAMYHLDTGKVDILKDATNLISLSFSR
ncbi:MAG: carbonic anhydrase [Candidatus Thermoplasmatota archaeon]|nr:carbonic anhydrase [Candidatus Thermoplasmatota archaeon]